MSYFYTPWKRQNTYGFELKWVNSIKIAAQINAFAMSLDLPWSRLLQTFLRAVGLLGPLFCRSSFRFYLP